MNETLSVWVAGARPRTLPAAVAPILAGSASAATSRSPCAMEAIRLSSSLRRSIIALESDNFAPASMSRALDCLSAVVFLSSASAMASRLEFFSAVVSFASSREADFACLASCVICSVKFIETEYAEGTC